MTQEGQDDSLRFNENITLRQLGGECCHPGQPGMRRRGRAGLGADAWAQTQ